MSSSTDDNKKLSTVATINTENRATRYLPRSSPAENDQISSDVSRLELLGEGSYGRVYRANCQRTGEIFAIKQIKIGEDTSKADAIREASLLRESQHKHVVRFYCSSSEDDRFNIRMEYCPKTLTNLISEGISPQEAWGVAVQITDALNYLHEKGIVHCDIRSDNILIDRKGRIKLADFGIAERLKSPPTTEDRTIVYTGVDAAIVKNDIKDLGRILFELVYGPFATEEERDEAIKKFLKSNPSSYECTEDNLPTQENLIRLLLTEAYHEFPKPREKLIDRENEEDLDEEEEEEEEETEEEEEKEEEYIAKGEQLTDSEFSYREAEQQSLESVCLSRLYSLSIEEENEDEEEEDEEEQEQVEEYLAKGEQLTDSEFSNREAEQQPLEDLHHNSRDDTPLLPEPIFNMSIVGQILLLVVVFILLVVWAINCAIYCIIEKTKAYRTAYYGILKLVERVSLEKISTPS